MKLTEVVLLMGGSGGGGRDEIGGTACGKGMRPGKKPESLLN